MPPATPEYRVTPKRPKNNTLFMTLPGTEIKAVSEGGHLSGLKSNRQVIGVREVILASTCRYSSQTAVSNNSFIRNV